MIFGIFLFSLIFLLRHYGRSFQKNYGLRLYVQLYISLFSVISFLGSLARVYVFSHVGLDLTPFVPLVLSVGAGQGLPLPSPSDPSSESSERETDSFGIQVLLESDSEKAEESSVNQPPADSVAVPEPEAAARSPRVVPYPYQPDEVIGGDSVYAIERRLLSAKPSPSYFDLMQARIDAEDLFEVKVEIVRIMSGLDPQGDWLGRGARALDNPRGTGEHSYDQLSHLLSDLQSGGIHSDSFKNLKGNCFLGREDNDDHSAA